MKRVSAYLGLALLALLAVGILGCAKADATSTVDPPIQPAEGEDNLYETISSAAFQLDTAVQALSEVLDQTRKLSEKSQGSIKTAYSSLNGLVDRAGETIGDYPIPPRSSQEVAKNREHFERWAKNALAASNHSLKIVLSAESLQARVDPEGRHSELTEKLRTAEDALRGALNTLKPASGS